VALDGGQNHQREGTVLGDRHTWACSDLPAVDMLNILKVVHKRVATQLWPLDTSMPICM